jgi:hypothetical protein
MDSTYHDKIRKEVNQEIFRKSFDRFRERYVKSDMFKNEQQIVADKFDVLLKFVFDKHLSQYENDKCGEYEKPLFPDEITIYTTWNENNVLTGLYENEDDDVGLYVRLVSSQIFEGYVYTISQYEKILHDKPHLVGDGIDGDLYYRTKLSQLKHDTAFRNDEFVIVYCGWNNDNDNHWDQEDGYDSHIEDDWEPFEYTDDDY